MSRLIAFVWETVPLPDPDNGSAAAKLSSGGAGREGHPALAPAANSSAHRGPHPAIAQAINSYDQHGCTALMIAAKCGYPRIVELLLEQGADAWLGDRSMGRTALHYAASKDQAEAVSAILGSAAVRAAEQGAARPYRLVDKPSSYGYTPLHYAAAAKAVKAAKALLRYGASPNAKSMETGTDVVMFAPGTTPLHVCGWRECPEIAVPMLRTWDARLRHLGMPDPRLMETGEGLKACELPPVIPGSDLYRILDPATSMAALAQLEPGAAQVVPVEQLLVSGAARSAAIAAAAAAAGKEGKALKGSSGGGASDGLQRTSELSGTSSTSRSGAAAVVVPGPDARPQGMSASARGLDASARSARGLPPLHGRVSEGTGRSAASGGGAEAEQQAGGSRSGTLRQTRGRREGLSADGGGGGFVLPAPKWMEAGGPRAAAEPAEELAAEGDAGSGEGKAEDEPGRRTNQAPASWARSGGPMVILAAASATLHGQDNLWGIANTSTMAPAGPVNDYGNSGSGSAGHRAQPQPRAAGGGGSGSINSPRTSGDGRSKPLSSNDNSASRKQMPWSFLRPSAGAPSEEPAAAAPAAPAAAAGGGAAAKRGALGASMSLKELAASMTGLRARSISAMGAGARTPPASSTAATAAAAAAVDPQDGPGGLAATVVSAARGRPSAPGGRSSQRWWRQAAAAPPPRGNQSSSGTTNAPAWAEGKLPWRPRSALPSTSGGGAAVEDAEPALGYATAPQPTAQAAGAEGAAPRQGRPSSREGSGWRRPGSSSGKLPMPPPPRPVVLAWGEGESNQTAADAVAAARAAARPAPPPPAAAPPAPAARPLTATLDRFRSWKNSTGPPSTAVEPMHGAGGTVWTNPLAGGGEVQSVQGGSKDVGEESPFYPGRAGRPWSRRRPYSSGGGGDGVRPLDTIPSSGGGAAPGGGGVRSGIGGGGSSGGGGDGGRVALPKDRTVAVEEQPAYGAGLGSRRRRLLAQIHAADQAAAAPATGAPGAPAPPSHGLNGLGKAGSAGGSSSGGGAGGAAAAPAQAVEEPRLNSSFKRAPSLVAKPVSPSIPMGNRPQRRTYHG